MSTSQTSIMPGLHPSALGCVAAAEDHFASAEANDVFRGFFAQARAGAGDDDGFGSKGGGGFGNFEDELCMDEVAERGHECSP